MAGQRQTAKDGRLLHVPYKGGGPAMIDLVTGQTQFGFASQPGAAGFIKDGRLRALAVTTARRSKLFPQLPTIAEAGVPGYESHAWYGFVVPAKAPQPVVSRLHRSCRGYFTHPTSPRPCSRRDSKSGP
jgi:tripartite-type tricarboxylate transporter receptor subunit TctC